MSGEVTQRGLAKAQRQPFMMAVAAAAAELWQRQHSASKLLLWIARSTLLLLIPSLGL